MIILQRLCSLDLKLFQMSPTRGVFYVSGAHDQCDFLSLDVC